ncbi:MAG: SPFH domain-containing protein [Bacteroidaceae bacterium]|nr:SPFH domain-containing protein [Bacteroidaceae bacterium]
MALIDCAKWKPQGDEFVFAYRYPQTNLSTYTQLIVYESQEALLFSKGQLMGKFGPGKHTLDTENLPLLRSLFDIPFGGKNPFTAEVWIVNKLYPANLSWSVKNMALHDVDYQTMLPLRAMGQYGIQVSDSEKFLIKMVGTKDEFTEADMLSQAYGEFASKAKSAIIQFMTAQKVGFKSVSAYLDNLSGYIKTALLPFWQEYGLSMTKFYITEISIDTSTEEGRKISEALASQASMSITGHSWQQEQMFGMANNAVDQIGNASGNGGLLAGLMAINMMGGGGMGGTIAGGMMQPHTNQPTFGGPQAGGFRPGDMPQRGAAPAAAREVYCANCSKKHLTTERFCPHCGAEYHPCPNCGADNLLTARRCVSCGTPLQANAGARCQSCGAPITPGSVFCSQCGAQQNTVSDGYQCTRCGALVPPTSRFCPKCGQKV